MVKNEEDHTITINSERYRDMLSEVMEMTYSYNKTVQLDT